MFIGVQGELDALCLEAEVLVVFALAMASSSLSKLVNKSLAKLDHIFLFIRINWNATV